MVAVSAWLDFMPQSISIAARTGTDTFGTATYGTATTYRCRLVGKRQQVLDGQGQQVVSNQMVYLATNVAVDPRARVTLSTADVGSTEAYAITPPLLATARYPDENGQHHTVLYL